MFSKVNWLAEVGLIAAMIIYLIYNDAIEEIPICLAIMICIAVIGNIANSALIKWLNRHK